MSSLPPSAERGEIAELARSSLGLESLRPGQAEAIEAVASGRDVLAVMSTGYGKSAIYQLAALILDGPTIVVSPLISLQRDQVDAIEERLPGEAARLSSDLSEGDREEILAGIEDGSREFVLLAPEQLAKPEVRRRLASARPSLLVVDEAHCISEWGHDFRPEYLRLGAFAEELGSPTTLALTATAAPPIRSEIVERLRMRDPEVIVRGFDRPNIHLSVDRFRKGEDKERALLDVVVGEAKPGIVYVATRAGAEHLTEELRDRGVAASHYHAGLSARERDELHEDFDADRVEVITATIAFGMGIDKPNVRFVHHAEISESLDSLYQELGRAGRDGEPARAKLFYRPEDQAVRRFFAAGGQVDSEEIERVAVEIERRDGPIDPADLAEAADVSQSKLTSAVTRLEDAGAVEISAAGEITDAEDGRDPTEAVAEAAEAADDREAFSRSRIEMIRGYAEHDGCRREYVLSYFGEAFEGPCGNCDNCDAGLSREDATERPYEVGSQVRHAEWGIGAVQRYDDGRVVVLFDSVGYRTLDLGLVADGDLLEPA